MHCNELELNFSIGTGIGIELELNFSMGTGIGIGIGIGIDPSPVKSAYFAHICVVRLIQYTCIAELFLFSENPFFWQIFTWSFQRGCLCLSDLDEYDVLKCSDSGS